MSSTQNSHVTRAGTARTGLPGQDSQDRTAGTEQPVQDSRVRIVGTGQYSQDMTAVTGELGKEQMRQGSRDRTAGTGQPGQDNLVGQPTEVCLYRAAGAPRRHRFANLNSFTNTLSDLRRSWGRSKHLRSRVPINTLQKLCPWVKTASYRRQLQNVKQLMVKSVNIQNR